MAIIKDPIAFRWRDTHGAITGVRLYSQDGARRHAVPVQRQPPIKQKFWMNNGVIVKAWRQLDFHDQDKWNDFGVDFPGTDKYGDPISWNGFHWFTRLNSRRLLMGAAVLQTPPADDVPTYTPVIYIEWDEVDERLLFYFAPPPADGEGILVALRKHCAVSRASPPIPIRDWGILTYGAGSPQVLWEYPGPYDEPRRHWVGAWRWDEYGRSAEAGFDSVITG